MLNDKLLHEIDFSINDATNRYYNSDGVSVPRVTEILSAMIHSDKLMMWANRIGLRGIEYMKELNRASTYGSQAHTCIERYLKNKEKTDSNIAFLGYLLWEKVLNDKGIEIIPILIEESLSCNWFGGTLDALLDISGNIYIVDFKTSNHVTFKYFLQLSAYLYMIRMRGYNPRGVIVLQLDKKCPGFNEYLLDFTISDHKQFMDYCTETFFALVYAYYNLERVKIGYRKIFKEAI